MKTSTMEKAHSKCIQWPISSKVKDNHFKIIHEICPVAEFLKRRFKFVVDPCSLCYMAEETLAHMFFFHALCPKVLAGY